MKIFNNFVPNGRSRAKLTLVCLALNYIIVTVGIIKGSDLSDLGTGLALLNAPLYAYILAQSIRPSKVQVDDNNLNKDKNE